MSTTSSAKNLGVLIDSDLTLSPYITSICKAANFHLNSLACIQKYLTLQALKIAVHSLVSSKMDYCKSLLIGLHKAHINRLQHVMNCVAWLVSGAGKFEDITPVLRDLHWLPVEQHLKFKVLCLTYKALHSLAPQYLRETLTPYKPSRSLRSSDQELWCTPKMRLKRKVVRAFSSVAPTLYIAVPLEIWQAPSLDCFLQGLLKNTMKWPNYPNLLSWAWDAWVGCHTHKYKRHSPGWGSFKQGDLVLVSCVQPPQDIPAPPNLVSVSYTRNP